MPDEPTRRIEEELKAYAEQRRAEAGPPFELHPVNRQLLQDEVARTVGSGKARVETGPSWLRLLWPRLAMAGAICLIGVFVVLRFLPDKTGSEYQMAKAPARAENAPTSLPSPPPSTPVATPAPAAPAEKERADRLLASARSDLQVESKARSAEVGATVGLSKQKDTAPAAAPQVSPDSAPVAPPPEAMMQRRYGLRPAPSREATQSRAASEAVTQSEPGSKSDSVAFAFTDTGKQPAGQRFVQVENRRRNFNSPPPPPVLRSFQLRQSGPQIEIVDADGSIYRGALGKAESARDEPVTASPAESLDRLSEVKAAAVARERPAGDTKAAAVPGLRFYVVGTNLSLNERVAFAGEMVTGTNSFGVGYAAGGQAGLPTVRTRAPTSTAAPTAAPRQLVPLLRIQGQATVGEGTKLEINATPVAR